MSNLSHLGRANVTPQWAKDLAEAQVESWTVMFPNAISKQYAINSLAEAYHIAHGQCLAAHVAHFGMEAPAPSLL